MTVTALLLIACVGFMPAGANRMAVFTGHPMEKVISMLSELSAKVTEEGKNEALTFAKFEYWCKGSLKTLNEAIAEENEQIDALTNKVDSKTKQHETLTDQIAQLGEEIKDIQVAAADEKAMRAKGNALYEEKAKDLGVTVKAIDEAIKAMNQAKDKVKKSFVQKKISAVESAIAVSHGAAKAQNVHDDLAKLAADDADEAEKPRERPTELKASGDEKGHRSRYSFKGGDILQMLTDLKADFQFEGEQLHTEETHAQNNYGLSKQARDEDLRVSEASKATKTKEDTEVQSALAAAKQSLADTQEDLQADTTTHDATTRQCSLKTSEFQERSQTRDEEVEAIAMAKKILAKVAGVRTEAPSNPVPPPNPVDGFLQLAMQTDVDDPKMKAVNLIRESAKSTHSKALERFSQEIAAHLDGPFDDMNNMIEKMMHRLMDEQNDEDKHKLWCDEELSTNNAALDHREDKRKELKAKLDANIATAAELKEQVKDANIMISKITAHEAEATEIRNEGKKENLVSIKDAEKAQTALAEATAVLTSFYKSSGEIAKEPYEFVQRGVNLPEEPSTWDASYTSVSGSDQPKGILTLLETTASDFSKMQAETEAQEHADQKAYEGEMKDMAIEKARRTTESEMKTQEAKRLTDKAGVLNNRLKETTKERDAVQQYLKDLEMACGDGKDIKAYEDRKKARDDEIEALRKAKGILADAFKAKPKEAEPKLVQIQKLRR